MCVPEAWWGVVGWFGLVLSYRVEGTCTLTREVLPQKPKLLADLLLTDIKFQNLNLGQLIFAVIFYTIDANPLMR